MEQAILFCVMLLAIAMAAALARERRIRLALQLLLRRIFDLQRSAHEKDSADAVSSERAGYERL